MELLEDLSALEAENPSLFATYQADKRRFEAANEFARGSGRFDLTARGKINTYALFAELFASLASKLGRAGIIVPAGMTTDYNSSVFFRSLLSDGRLVRSLAFDNQKRVFPAVHPDTPFTLLTMGRSDGSPEFASYLLERDHLNDPRRRYSLSAEDIARINPNTKTAPVFRSRADAELTAKIYARVPVLIDESKGKDGNRWGVEFRQGLFNMTSDSGLFRTAAQLAEAGFVRDGSDWVERQSVERYVPLYEAKMIHQFDHRWATYDAGDSRDATGAEKTDPDFEPTPRYWVPAREVAERLAAKGWTPGWLMGWRDITNATNERTVIAAAFPRVGVGNNLPLMLFDSGGEPEKLAALVGSLDSLAADFFARHKVGGTHLNFFIYQQLPVLPPSSYTTADLTFIVPRVLELTYTSHSMAPFARDLGYDGPPFQWDEDRRAQLRAELDAFYARAYGLTRDELRYILDPADVKGADYPSETFRVLKTNEIRRFGEYRTARLVLQAWDRVERGEIREVSAPITVTAPSIAPIDTARLPDGAWATPAGGNVRDKTLAQIAAVLKALSGPTPVALARRAALYALEPRLLTARLQGAERAEWLRLVGAEAEPRQGVPTAGLGRATGWGEAVRFLAATECLVEDTAAQTWTRGRDLDLDPDRYLTDSWPQRARFALQQAAKILTDESAAPPSAEEEEGLTALAA
jgi:hypothetical protein